jgi:ADP-ribose pyrophosphatase YjhB (NUDIX family)
VTIWTPSTAIRVKVIGLAWRGDKLLLAEVEESSGRVKGARPLGGCVEFGETREQALHREFEEELGCGITLAGPWHSFENIYEHEGATGHEYLFAANIILADTTLYTKEEIAFLEDNGIGCSARWWSPTALPTGVDLYPRELIALIDAGVVGPER